MNERSEAERGEPVWFDGTFFRVGVPAYGQTPAELAPTLSADEAEQSCSALRDQGIEDAADALPGYGSAGIRCGRLRRGRGSRCRRSGCGCGTAPGGV